MKTFCPRHGLSALSLIALGVANAQAQQPATTTTTQTTQTKIEAPGQATTTTTTTTTTKEKVVATEKRAGEIATQPARDVGVQKIDIPPAIQQAAAAPYSLAGTRTCAQLNHAMFELNDALGPDYSGGVTMHEDKAGKLAEAGGKAVVNTIIPFRGLVREISGAAPAQRRLDAAIQAGYARRGFLRGVATARKCRLR